VTCHALEVPAHGIVNCSHSSEELTWGATCKFSCEEGFALTGPAVLQCGSSGAWDKQQPACAAVTCEAITWPEEGFVSCEQASTDLTYRSLCHFHCNKGYVLQGPSSVHCVAQNQWSNQFPKCKAVTCAALEKPAHGIVNCSHSSEELTWGASCKFSCEEGFALTGQSVLQCGFSGAWDKQQPACAVVQCEPLNSPENGFVDCIHGTGSFTYSTACHFSCAEGWRLNGSHVLECDHSGNWNASLPTCEASEQGTYLSVGIAATSASLLSTASFLLWLARRF
ncbi:LYAM2 protein, partial [Eudromia elegans]|nr:LYAM2 protein [Eudromia elegans]